MIRVFVHLTHCLTKRGQCVNCGVLQGMPEGMRECSRTLAEYRPGVPYSVLGKES